ncbi:GNAT family N-acetyltransferase [Fulvivirga maritima]|uniref:GNAT family N-acetyltransferase n=1 Tax=Fulvivirga maritima TaxID=2904247 RepID=UPI001F1DAB2A|nr:GNAT family N-acetyltransferase [Fulvivirga maritima]UII27359.1 GNAT family N-acetyltransferase [Fulvivirga maritima]
MNNIIAVENVDQLNNVEKLATQIWHEHYTPLIGKEQVEYMLNKFQSVAAMQEQLKQGYLYFLILNNNTPCGYLSVQPRDNNQELFLSKIYVSGDFRGKGIGKKLMQHAISIAKSLPAQKIRLTVNKDNAGSIAAYHKMGFTTTDMVKTDIGNGFYMDDYILELPLH